MYRASLKVAKKPLERFVVLGVHPQNRVETPKKRELALGVPARVSFDLLEYSQNRIGTRIARGKVGAPELTRSDRVEELTVSDAAQPRLLPAVAARRQRRHFLGKTVLEHLINPPVDAFIELAALAIQPDYGCLEIAARPARPPKRRERPSRCAVHLERPQNPIGITVLDTTGRNRIDTLEVAAQRIFASCTQLLEQRSAQLGLGPGRLRKPIQQPA